MKPKLKAKQTETESLDIAPGTTVIVSAIDWITGEHFTFHGSVESLAGGGYMVTSDEPRSRYGIFAKGKVRAL